MSDRCKNCRYHRVPGAMDTDIPGTGKWCSNSKSAQFRTRTADDDTCDKFEDKGKKAPAFIRIANRVARKLERK